MRMSNVLIEALDDQFVWEVRGSSSNIAKRKYQKYFKNWDQIAFQFFLTVLIIIIIYLDIVSYSEHKIEKVDNRL